MEVTRIEQRAYIKTTVLRGRNAMECNTLGNNALTNRTVARWVGNFQHGCVSTSDEQRSGRPVSVRTDLARAIIEQLTDDDRRWPLLGILRNELHLRRIAAWLMHELPEVQRWLSYAVYSDHFTCWQHDSDQFFSRIIDIDEFWTRAYEPELKRQSEAE
ncbi:UNVERIFIED_CONTAM: Histone-lysine N-methyltransferase SETMAR [Trichonephila clavipes]